MEPIDRIQKDLRNAPYYTVLDRIHPLLDTNTLRRYPIPRGAQIRDSVIDTLYKQYKLGRP